ncbi:MAG TPA: DUF222 domain-containing protein [Jatrophihabitans sp.]|nr:DUF222 domain-containing protein [Jatrophihabitans sp.]
MTGDVLYIGTSVPDGDADGADRPVSRDASQVDYSLIDYRTRLELLSALQRAKAKLDAQEQVLLHSLATDHPSEGIDPEHDKQWVREDVSCAMRIAPVNARAKLLEATELVTRLPATLSMLGRGEIPVRHATRRAEAVIPLSDEIAAQVEARVLPRAPRQTIGQFTAAVRRAVLALDPRDPEKKTADAVAERRVCFTPQDDGTTELWASLPAAGAAALRARLRHDAQKAKQLRDGRTADQRQADALIDLALGDPCEPASTSGQQLKPRINVIVALSTLLGLDNQPGELDGHGPIPAAMARALAFDPTGTWRRLLTDQSGQVVDAGRTVYKPPAPLERLIQTRDVTCRFPTCRRAAVRSEIDHIIAWLDNGPTARTCTPYVLDIIT